MHSITTYTGKHFDPTAPNPDLIDIKDIAHALSLLCRGNGQVKTFFSVGQHCINAAKEAIFRGHSNRLVLACLLHDAAESYLSDVPRPLKVSMPEYVQAESQLLNCIYEKYLGYILTSEEEKLLKSIDNALLYYDLKELLGEISKETAPDLGITLSYKVVPFHEVEEEYLKLFHKYYEKIT